MKSDAVVRARIPAETKDRAVAVLQKMGLTASDLIRLTFLRAIQEVVSTQYELIVLRTGTHADILSLCTANSR